MVQRILLLCGVITPIWFIGTIIIFGAFFPGYNQIRDHISALGALESPVAGLMNPFGFMLTGVLVVLFSIGLYRAMQFGLAGKIATLCFVATGIFLAALGFLPCDPECFNVSPTAQMHDLASQILFGFMIVAFFLYTFESRVDESFRRYSRFGFVAAIVLAILAFIELFIPNPVPGLVQRVMVGIPLAIMGFFGLKMSRRVE